MGSLTPIKRKNGGTSNTGAYIDSTSYTLLLETLIGFMELLLSENDQGRYNEELECLTHQLESLAKRFTPPKGVA